MPLVFVQSYAPSTVYEVGTQYIDNGVVLTLGQPTNVDMSASIFDAAGTYVLFKIETGGVFDSNTVSRIDVTAVPAGRSVVQQGGNDAFWDADTSTVRVRLA